jgi:7-carboxy-7-deazaguanine synthase
MKVAEIFQSIQGEGRLAGVRSVFVRTSGCNLRCVFCDTPYTSWEAEGETLSVDAIVGRLAHFQARHVVVTGGEPMIAAEIEDLCTALAQSGYHITVETAATVFKPVACHLASLSPKLANSTPRERDGGRFAVLHEEHRWRPEVIKAFMELCDYQLKFVIDVPADVDDVCRALDQIKVADPERVLLMPQGVTKEELSERAGWLVDLCVKHGFRYCPRVHIELFGNVRGT